MATTGTIKGVCDNKNYTLTCVWNVVSSTETTSTITAKVYLKAPNGWSTFSNYWDCTINGTKVTDNKSTWVKSESVLLGQKTWTVSHSSNGDCSVNISFSYVNGLQSENMNQHTTHQGSGSGVAKINSVSPSKPIQVFTPKKENIILYEENETNFSHNGIYILKPLECIITRSLVDYVYELDMKYPMDDDGYWKAIIEGRIIKANGQLFRIIQTNILVVDSIIEIYAKHVFFDLQKNFIEEVNVRNKKGNVALAELINGTAYQHNFSFLSESTNSKSFKCVRKNVLDALLGEEDSFVQLWGGELDIDNFNVSFLKQVGSNKGYKIKYGKNLTGLTLKTDHSTVITQIKPTGFDGIGLGQGNYVISSNVNNYCMPIIKEINYEHVKWTGSPNYDKDENDDEASVYKTLELAQAELRRLASLEFSEKEVDLPSVTCEVNFVELANTEEYHQLKGLETISLGDIVTIEHQPLGINIKARCIGYTYDCLKLQYEEVIIGDYQKGFFRETSNVTQKVTNGDLNIEEKLQSVYVQSVNKMSETMNNAMNGYVVLGNSEILIMDTDDKKTAQKVWKFNSSGIAYSSTGYEGKYTVGLTMDGHINGSIITANSIQGGMLELETITARELAVNIQETLNSAMTEETTQALITSNLDTFESNLSKTFVTEEEASQQIQSATEKAVEEATQKIVSTSVEKAMENVDDQLSGKLSDFSTNVMNPALQQAMSETLQDSKNYVVKVTGDYYTKEETDSKISQTREKIEIGISNTYETKENTSVKITEAIDGVTVGAINRVFGTAEEKTKTFTGVSNDIWNVYDISSDISDKDIIVSFEYDMNVTVVTGSNLMFQPYYLSTSNQATYYPSVAIIDSTSTKTINVKNQQFSFATKLNAVQQDCKFRFRADGVTGTFTIRKAQIKVGNKITEWSIAPEDIENNANNYTVEQLKSYYTKLQTESRITALQDSIGLKVSELEEDMTSIQTSIESGLGVQLTNYYTKEEANAEIELAKNSITNVVEETYVSKLELDKMTTGGENLLPNGNFAYDLANWETSEPSSSKNPNASNKKIQINGNNGWMDATTNTLQIVARSLPDRYGVQSDTIELVADTEYVISGYYAGHRVEKVQINIRDMDNYGENISTVDYDPVSGGNSLSKYGYFEHTFKTTSSTKFAVNLYGKNFQDNESLGYVWFAKIKLEQGNKASAWSPCSKDSELYMNLTAGQISNELGDLSQIVARNIGSDSITSAMKNKLISEYNDAMKVYDRLSSVYANLGDTTFKKLPEELNTAKTNLTIVIDSLKSTINDADESGLSNVLDKFNKFYDIAEKLSQSISNSLAGYSQETRTKVEQLATDYKITTSIVETIGESVNELTTSFNFNTDGLTIKSTQDATKYIKLDNNSLDFMDNGTMVAQISDEELFITNAEVENEMKIGNIKIKPSGIGGIMFIYE